MGELASTDSKPGKKTKERPSQPPSPCPKCNLMHWLSDCKAATEAEKMELRKKLREERAAKGRTQRQRAKRVKDCLPDGQRTVTVNGCLELPYCADTGVDKTIFAAIMSSS